MWDMTIYLQRRTLYMGWNSPTRAKTGLYVSTYVSMQVQAGPLLANSAWTKGLFSGTFDPAPFNVKVATPTDIWDVWDTVWERRYCRCQSNQSVNQSIRLSFNTNPNAPYTTHHIIGFKPWNTHSALRGLAQ